MTKVNPNNGNEPNQTFLNISMTFIIATFESHCKSERNPVKGNKITQDICKSESIFRISITIKIFLKHLVCFEHQNHVMLF